MLFNVIRESKGIKLAALFAFAASSSTATFPRESAEALEFRILTDEYTKRPWEMSPARFERFNELYKKARSEPLSGLESVLSASGAFCAHGGGSAATGGGTGGGGACPCRPIWSRREKKDLSRLLSIDHWL